MALKIQGEGEDFRYVTKDESRDFHKQRRAFVIYQGKVLFIEKGRDMSHWEFCQENFPAMTRKEFNQIIRGYYLDGNLVFYKDNFCYDDKVIEVALEHIPEIKKNLGLCSVKINFGLVIGKAGENWPVDLYYGQSLASGEIVKNNVEKQQKFKHRLP